MIKIANCPIKYLDDTLFNKSKVIIIFYLIVEEMGFNDLKESIVNISTATLSKSLKELIKDGYLTKKIIRDMPPKVIYYPTKKSKTMIPVLLEMVMWGNKQINQKEDFSKIIEKVKSAIIKE